MRRWLKRLFGLGVLAAIAYWLWRLVDEQPRRSGIEWVPQPFPAPPMPVPHPDAGPVVATAPSAAPGAPTPPTDSPWVEPNDDHCPASHPVKAKVASGIYHVPGGQMYERTRPDRCYRDAASADADGLRASKR